ncbi:MAG: ATP-binding protein [Gallionella sp.]
MPIISTSYLYRCNQWIAKHLPFLIQKKRGGLHRYLFTLVLIIVALWARIQIAPLHAGLQYLTFFPAVAIAAVIGGVRAGLFATAMGILFATFIFTPPYYTFSIQVIEKSFFSNLVFLVDGLIVSFSIESMHHYRQQYEHELEEVKASETRTKAINLELDEFTYIASHDLKEPLRGIHNYSSFLKEDYADQLDEDAQQYINRIQRLAERMSTLIDTLLAYSRLGSIELKKESVDLDVIVGGVMEDLCALREEGVEMRHVGHLGHAKGDATLIGEIFQNLISNSVKYNDKPDKWVEIGCKEQDTLPVYYVRDNGIGIAPQHQDSVFRIFKRLHEQNKYGGGTGAGLTIVKKIIERHGGRIWLESKLDLGTTFYFTMKEGKL